MNGGKKLNNPQKIQQPPAPNIYRQMDHSRDPGGNMKIVPNVLGLFSAQWIEDDTWCESLTKQVHTGC